MAKPARRRKQAAKPAKGVSTRMMRQSLLFGRGLYEMHNSTVKDPLPVADKKPTILLKNYLTGERFFVRKCREGALERLQEAIFHPPCRDDILWPCDLLPLDSRMAQFARLPYDRYEVFPEPPPPPSEEAPAPEPAETEQFYGLLFSVDDLPALQSFDAAMEQRASLRVGDIGTEKGCNWKNPAIRQLAAALLIALQRLNAAGYLYADFDPRRFFFTSKGALRAVLDFSPLVFPAALPVQHGEDVALHPEPGHYPIEFAEPGYVQGTVPHLDAQSQNYSLTAFLFHLLYSRYPYDGSLQSGHVDDSPQAHEIRFRDYFSVPPIFIFDPEDTTNSLGIFEEEQALIDLWEQSPEGLQTLFLQTLRRDNALRQDGRANPGPEQFLALFEALEWLHS